MRKWPFFSLDLWKFPIEFMVSMASLKTPSKQHDVHFVSYFSILCKMDEKIGYGLMCCYPRLTSSIHGVFSFRSQLHPLVRIWSPLAQGDQDGNGHNATQTKRLFCTWLKGKVYWKREQLLALAPRIFCCLFLWSILSWSWEHRDD